MVIPNPNTPQESNRVRGYEIVSVSHKGVTGQEHLIESVGKLANILSPAGQLASHLVEKIGAENVNSALKKIKSGMDDFILQKQSNPHANPNIIRPAGEHASQPNPGNSLPAAAKGDKNIIPGS